MLTLTYHPDKWSEHNTLAPDGSPISREEMSEVYLKISESYQALKPLVKSPKKQLNNGHEKRRSPTNDMETLCAIKADGSVVCLRI
jgi:hypothetical protein